MAFAMLRLQGGKMVRFNPVGFGFVGIVYIFCMCGVMKRSLIKYSLYDLCDLLAEAIAKPNENKKLIHEIAGELSHSKTFGAKILVQFCNGYFTNLK